MQQYLKPTTGSAWTWVIATELLEKLLAPVHDAVPAFDLCLGREALLTLARRLETRTGRGTWLCVS